MEKRYSQLKGFLNLSFNTTSLQIQGDDIIEVHKYCSFIIIEYIKRNWFFIASTENGPYSLRLISSRAE